MTTYELTLADKWFYKIAERLYSVHYRCSKCKQGYNVKGAMPRRTYFCDLCRGTLSKGR